MKAAILLKTAAVVAPLILSVTVTGLPTNNTNAGINANPNGNVNNAGNQAAGQGTSGKTNSGATDITPPNKASDQSYNTTIKHFECGTTADTHATDEFLAKISNLHQQDQQQTNPAKRSLHDRRLHRRGNSSAANSITVPLYIHVVSSSSNSGMVTQKMVSDQVGAMNTAYNPVGIRFILQNASNTINDAWASDATSQDDMNMKQALRQGGYSSLNLYFQTDLAGGILGKCTLPTTVPVNSPPSSYVNDGCNIAAGTMPNGPIMGYNMGKTAVHETGHWLGLLHTFEGYTCSGNGDYITDTPSESQSTDGCPTNPAKNTCPRTTKGQVDPIHNFMDYSIDSCYIKFTAGQQTRMMTLWPEFRQGRTIKGDPAYANRETGGQAGGKSGGGSNPSLASMGLGATSDGKVTQQGTSTTSSAVGGVGSGSGGVQKGNGKGQQKHQKTAGTPVAPTTAVSGTQNQNQKPNKANGKTKAKPTDVNSQGHSKSNSNKKRNLASSGSDYDIEKRYASPSSGNDKDEGYENEENTYLGSKRWKSHIGHVKRVLGEKRDALPLAFARANPSARVFDSDFGKEGEKEDGGDGDYDELEEYEGDEGDEEDKSKDKGEKEEKEDDPEDETFDSDSVFD